MDDDLARRIVDLELRFMQNEKTLQDLSDVLVDQQKTIDRLVAEVRVLRERLPAEGEPIGDEPPPHY